MVCELNLLPYAISHINFAQLTLMDECRIFIINGLMTVFLAILGRILIVDFPDKVHRSHWPFLKPHEVKAVQDKLDRDRRDAEFDELTMKKFLSACSRWELWFL